jgi:hypothetical protein
VKERCVAPGLAVAFALGAVLGGPEMVGSGRFCSPSSPQSRRSSSPFRGGSRANLSSCSRGGSTDRCACHRLSLAGELHGSPQRASPSSVAHQRCLWLSCAQAQRWRSWQRHQSWHGVPSWVPRPRAHRQRRTSQLAPSPRPSRDTDHGEKP